MPQQNGSRSSSSSVASALTKRVPVMVGAIWPLRAIEPAEAAALNVLPMMLSCTQRAPSASLPSAARQASFALVPVPQGERS